MYLQVIANYYYTTLKQVLQYLSGRKHRKICLIFDETLKNQ